MEAEGGLGEVRERWRRWKRGRTKDYTVSHVALIPC